MVARKKTAVAPAKKENLPAAMDFSGDADAGFENADRDSYAVPFLKLLQAMSPQCKRSNGAYIAGAEEGMILDTINETVTDGSEGITIIPVHYERKVIEWESTEVNSGLIAIHDIADGLEMLKHATRDDKNNDVLSNGHVLLLVNEHFVIVVGEDGSLQPALIGMSKSQQKVSRKWMSQMKGLRMTGPDGSFTPPMFANRYRLSSVPENSNGNDYMNWKVEIIGPVESEEQYLAAKSFRDAVFSGDAKVDHAAAAGESATTDGKTENEDDVPF